MPKMRLRLEIEVSPSLTVGEVKRRVEDRLRGPTQEVVWEKGTMPEPSTLRHGEIAWGSATVKQGPAPQEDIATIARRLTPAQIRLLKSLAPVAGAKGTFTYPTSRGIRCGLQSGWAMFRRGLVEPDPAMAGAIQQSECGTRGFIVLTELGRRVRAEVARAD